MELKLFPAVAFKIDLGASDGRDRKSQGTSLPSGALRRPSADHGARGWRDPQVARNLPRRRAH